MYCNSYLLSCKCGQRQDILKVLNLNVKGFMLFVIVVLSLVSPLAGDLSESM